MPNTNLKQLKYNQVRLALLNLAAELQIGPGGRLPPERQLAEKLECSSTTIRYTLAQLENEGVVTKRHGLGNFLNCDLNLTHSNGQILYISVTRKDMDSPGVPVERMRRFLAERGIRLAHLVVSAYSREIIEISRNCIGIILQGWLTDEFLEQVKLLKLPMVIAGNSGARTDIPIISLDFEDIAYRLTRLHIEAGLKKICLIPGEQDYYPGQQYRQGYQKAMREAGLPFEDLICNNWQPFRVYYMIDEFMKQHGLVDALLMEHYVLRSFFSWCWENNYSYRPRIGIFAASSDYHSYHQSPGIVWGHFPGFRSLPARLLLESILTGRPVNSQACKGVIHGIDDDQTDFIS